MAVLLYSCGMGAGCDRSKGGRGDKVGANDPITHRATSFRSRIRWDATPTKEMTRVDRCARLDIHGNLGTEYMLILIDFSSGRNVDRIRLIGIGIEIGIGIGMIWWSDSKRMGCRG
jgi:hypothetical protein